MRSPCDGVYTGRLVGGLLHGEAKAAAIRALAAREGLDLARCSAYSDSANDLPMLRLVGQPAVVNPDAELRAEARRNGWPVHDFRSGRKATLIALPAAAGAGAVAGGCGRRRAAPPAGAPEAGRRADAPGASPRRGTVADYCRGPAPAPTAGTRLARQLPGPGASPRRSLAVGSAG